MRSCLVKTVNKSLDCSESKVIFSSLSTLSNLFHFKDTLQKKVGSFYFTDTRKVTAMLPTMARLTVFFFTRASKHVGVSDLTEKKVKNAKSSAVPDLLLECDCFIDFSSFDILAADASS